MVSTTSGSRRPRSLRARLEALLDGDERPRAEMARLAELMALWAELPPPPDRAGPFPSYPALHARFLAAAHGTDGDGAEECFNELYCHVHGHEAPYTRGERARVDATGGYWCHAGGLSPIIKAAPFIESGTVSADFGAGNGLQGLLLQKLYPHARTVQIEISSHMVAAGQQLQGWLGIEPDRVDWQVADVCEISPRGMNFIYLYRPLKPHGPGDDFYRRFAAELDGEHSRVVIFSVADCLQSYLPKTFEVFYDDGHLRCFRRPGCT